MGTGSEKNPLIAYMAKTIPGIAVLSIFFIRQQNAVVVSTRMVENRKISIFRNPIFIPSIPLMWLIWSEMKINPAATMAAINKNTVTRN